jgi:nucleotide-binding universal stress UspA family protein
MVALKERLEASRFAMASAHLEGWGRRAEIVHVLESDSDLAFVAADAMVRDALEDFRARGFVAEGHVFSMPKDGVANRLAQHAAEAGADLIVMGSRGLGHAGGLLGRSVSHALLAKTALPVMVVPNKAHLSTYGVQRVLAAVADEGESDQLLETLRQIGHDVEVLVVHVPRLLGVHLGQKAKDSFGEVPESSPVVLDQTRQALRLGGIKASTRTLPRERNVARAIAEAACQSEADLIIVGSRRLPDWEALVAGSTAHGLLGCSDRPVLIAGRISQPAAHA